MDTITIRDLAKASDKDLERLLKFAHQHDDVAGAGLFKTLPTNREEIINQLIWIGVIK